MRCSWGSRRLINPQRVVQAQQSRDAGSLRGREQRHQTREDRSDALEWCMYCTPNMVSIPTACVDSVTHLFHLCLSLICTNLAVHHSACTLFSGFAVLKQKQSEPMHCAPPSSAQLRLHTPDNPPQCTRPPPPLRCRCCTHPRQQPPQLPKSHSCFETRGPIGPLPDCVGGCGCGGGGVGGDGVSWGCRGGRLVLVRGPQRAFHRSWTG